MQVQLGGDGADRPVIGVVSAQDFCFSFGGKGHRCSCSVGNDELDSAGSLDAPLPATGNGSGRSVLRRLSPAPSVQPSVNQQPDSEGNPDASLSASAPDSGAAVRHADVAPDGWPGNAVRLLSRHIDGRLGRSPHCNSDDRDHSGCKSSPPGGSGRTGSVFQESPSAFRANGSRWQRPLRDILGMQRCLMANGRDSGSGLAVGFGVAPASPPARSLSTPSVQRLPRYACQTTFAPQAVRRMPCGRFLKTLDRCSIRKPQLRPETPDSYEN